MKRVIYIYIYYIYIYTYPNQNSYKMTVENWLVSIELSCLKSRIAAQVLNGLVVYSNMLSNITL